MSQTALSKSLCRKLEQIRSDLGGKENVVDWMRSLHPNGAIWAWKPAFGKDPITTSFAVMSDGKIIEDRHENLVGLFSGPGDVAIGAKKKFHDKY